MQKNYSWLLIAVITLFTACNKKASDTFELNGKIQGAENKKLILESMSFPSVNNPKFTLIDTVTTANDGTFKIKHNLPERMVCRLSVDGNRNAYYIISLYNEKMELNANVTKQGAPDVTGSSATLSLYGLLDAVRKYDSTAMMLNDSLVHMRSTGKDSLADVMIKEMQNNYYAVFKGYADTASDVSNAIIALETLFEPDFDYVKNYAAKAAASKDSASLYVKELKEKVKLQEAELAQSFIGKPFTDIMQNDPGGKPLKLSDLKGQVILIDFWASWCQPCRKENPNVVAVYNKYKSKNFTVFSVSLDDSKADWIKAIQTDGLTWKTHVAALDNQNNKAATDYRITGIPMNFLVDKNGIIVAQNLRGSELEAKVKEITGL